MRLLGGSDIKENCQNESCLTYCAVRRMVMQRAVRLYHNGSATASAMLPWFDSKQPLHNPSGVIPNCRFESGPHSHFESSIYR